MVANDAAVSYDEAHFSEILNVLQRIAGDDEHVGQLPFFERAQLVGNGEDLASYPRRRFENVLVAQAGVLQQLQLKKIVPGVGALFLERNVGPPADLDAGDFRPPYGLDVVLMGHREAPRHREEETAGRNAG